MVGQDGSYARYGREGERENVGWLRALAESKPAGFKIRDTSPSHSRILSYLTTSPLLPSLSLPPILLYSLPPHNRNNGKSSPLPLPPPLLSYPRTHPLNQVFLFGTNFTETRLVARALQSFYALGPQLRTQLMSRFHIHASARIGDLSAQQIDALAAELGTLTIENDARRGVVENIKRLRDMGTVRGRRHAMGLPVRGQRTRSQVSGRVRSSGEEGRVGGLSGLGWDRWREGVCANAVRDADFDSEEAEPRGPTGGRAAAGTLIATAGHVWICTGIQRARRGVRGRWVKESVRHRTTDLQTTHERLQGRVRRHRLWHGEADAEVWKDNGMDMDGHGCLRA